jgi:predicted nucleic acid-binding protein
VRLLEADPRLRTSSQVIREYLAVATRPAEANGLGLSVGDALANVREFRRRMRLLPEERPILPVFLSLLEEIPCRGKRIHDAHLVATAIVHRVRTIVTLNGEDFEPFAARITAIEPRHGSRSSR